MTIDINITLFVREQRVIASRYQGTHKYLPDEMKNDRDSSDDDLSYTSLHTGQTYTGRKRDRQPKEGAEDQRKSLTGSYR